jgi:uncharacterized lipoprotein YmbA
MRPGQAFAAAGISLALAGCLADLRQPYPEKVRYTLEVHRRPDVAAQASAPLVNAVLRVRQVRVAPLFERKGFVYRTAEARYESDFYNELYAPPGVVFHQELVEWLRGADLFTQVVGGGNMEAADWLLDVRIEELYADLRGGGSPEAVLSLSVALHEAGAPRDADPALRERHVLREPAARPAAEALVDAWTALMAEAFRRVESALRRHLQHAA